MYSYSHAATTSRLGVYDYLYRHRHCRHRSFGASLRHPPGAEPAWSIPRSCYFRPVHYYRGLMARSIRHCVFRRSYYRPSYSATIDNDYSPPSTPSPAGAVTIAIEHSSSEAVTILTDIIIGPAAVIYRSHFGSRGLRARDGTGPARHGADLRCLEAVESYFALPISPRCATRSNSILASGINPDALRSLLSYSAGFGKASGYILCGH